MAETREKQLADYTELLETIEELRGQADEDEAVMAVIEEAVQQVAALAAALNAGEGNTIAVTPGLVKVRLPGETEPVILFPAPPASQDRPHRDVDVDDDDKGSLGDGEEEEAEEASINTKTKKKRREEGTTAAAAVPLSNAPYEVLYDEREWLSCVITGLVPPSTPTERRRYRAWILGYNIEETVTFERLRPWAPAAELTASLSGGAACHGIHPRTGRFAPATVDRLTLEGTVVLVFAGAGPGTAEERLEVPLSHVRVGHFYEKLFKTREISEEEKARRRAENAERRRERLQAAKRAREETIKKSTGGWNSMVGDLLEGSGGGGDTDRSRKRRRF